MNNISETSQFIAFFDECRGHSLTKIDRDFPLFLLALASFRNQIEPLSSDTVIDVVCAAFGDDKGVVYYRQRGSFIR